jgi:hypothetical protein
MDGGNPFEVLGMPLGDITRVRIGHVKHRVLEVRRAALVVRAVESV